MDLTLQQIVATACNRLGLVAPTAVVGNTDPQIIQLLALTNEDCISLYRGHDWTDLQTEFIINVADPITTTGDVDNTAIITNIPSTAGLDTSYAVSSINSPQSQRVAEVLSSTSVRCEMRNTGVAAGTEVVFGKDTYDIPTDFDRYIGQTWWDRTNHWRLIGPDSPQQDQYVRSGIFATGPRRRWRQVGRRPAAWRIWPPPFAGGAPAPGALVWEYISENWVVKANNTTGPLFTADSDIPLIDTELIIKGVKWRFWAIKGFDFASMQQEYIDAVNAKFATDGGIPDLYLNRRTGPFLISSANVQDGFWPGPGNP